MDPPRFLHHYRKLISGLRRCGMPTPWLQKYSLFLWSLRLTYDALLIALICFTVFIYVYPIVMDNRTFEELCVLIHGIFLFWGVLAITGYHLMYRRRLKRFTEDLDTMARRIFESQLGQEEPFLQVYSKNAAFIGTLSKAMPLFQACCAFLYCLSVPVVDWFAKTYRTRHPLPIDGPFDVMKPVVYEILVFVVGGTLSLCCSKKGLNDCLFLSFFDILTAFLQYLSMSMNALQKEFMAGDNVMIRRKILIWVKLHQDINRNIQGLLHIFSPIVIIYYVYVIGFLITAAFVQMKKENDNIIQSTGAGGSAAVIFMQIFMMSNTAGKMTAEAQKLSYAIYNMPWYVMNTSNRKLIIMVLAMCNKPIQVTAYRAPVFLLNRETFAGVMLSAVSGFVTLCQMKDRFG